jgi:hypothetical protein
MTAVADISNAAITADAKNAFLTRFSFSARQPS